MTELQIISKLGDSERPPTTLTSVRVKTPRRILHFSDGTLEEYSTDDEVDGPRKDGQIAEQQLGPPTMFHHVLTGGNKILAACDFVGEKIAAALGITTPKYKYEIDQFKKIQKERETVVDEEKSTGGWMQDTHNVQYKLCEKDNNNIPYPVISQDGLKKF